MEGLSRAREANGPQIREMLPGLLTAEQLARVIHGSRAAAAATQAQSSQVRQVVASHGEDDDEADVRLFIILLIAIVYALLCRAAGLLAFFSY